MGEPTIIKQGDPCPNCGDELKPVPPVSAERRALAARRDDPFPLPATADTAPDSVRKELGELFRCVACKYATRFLQSSGTPAAAGKAATR